MRIMKDSGIEYIGQIPANWDVQSLKYFGFTKSGLGNKKPQDFGHGYPFISYKNIYANFSIDESFEDRVESTETERENCSVLRGDAFFTGSSETIEELGMASMCLKDIPDATYNGFSIRFRPYTLDKYYPEFMMYYFRSIATREHLVRHDNSITRANLSQRLLNKLPVLVPSFDEQVKLATYLDKNVALVDNIIKKTKESIEEYKKYKQSIITETVTKGLDPNVKMKDSGIEWIGKIPEHWEFVKIKSLFHEVNERNDDEDAVLLSLFTALGVAPRSEMEEKGNKAVTVINYKKVKTGDLIVNKLLAWMGAVAFSGYEGVTSPDYDVYRFHENAITIEEFYEWYFRFTNFKDDCYRYGRGIMMMRWRTYPSEFKIIQVVNPPLEEQIQIVEFLRKKVNEIDTLISKKEVLLTELETYKKSLIYEVVTGKKEIR